MAIVVALILILSIVLISYIEVRKHFINKKLHAFKPINGIFPILGVVLRVLGTTNTSILDELFKLFYEAKSTTSRLWIGWILAIFTYDSNVVEILLTNEHCLNKPYMYKQLHISTSLLVVEKESWKIKRRAMNSAFSKLALKRYLPALNEKTRILTEKFDAHIDKRCNVYRKIFIGMIDTVTRTLMGVNMNMQSDRGESTYATIKQIMDSAMYRVVGRAEQLPLKSCIGLIDEIYRQKIDDIKKLNADYLDEVNRNGVNNVLEKCLQLERDGIFNYENIVEHMSLTIIAGIDTSAITIYGSLLLLAINQKHQELVDEEMRSIFDTADCEINQGHLAAMKYTERVIKESMRLLPPIPAIARELSADVEFPNGTLPKGTIVGVSIMHMHRNPDVWGENVLEFDPDRFLPENVAKRPPFSYIPFSGGPRNCIGMRYAMQTAKITLAYLLRKYKFSTDLKFNDINVSTHLILNIDNDKPLHIERRTF